MMVPRGHRAVQEKDGDGYVWVVPAETDSTHMPAVNVWWSRTTKTFRGKKLAAEFLVLRQVTDDEHADVITLSAGQVYDLIDALNRAVENP